MFTCINMNKSGLIRQILKVVSDFKCSYHCVLCPAQVDKVTGRFNGQFKTYAICGAIRRMVSFFVIFSLQQRHRTCWQSVFSTDSLTLTNIII